MTGSTGLLFHAHCGVQEGYGHVMRCLALATAARNCGIDVFLQTNDPNNPALRGWLALGAHVIAPIPGDSGAADAAALLATAATIGAQSIVVDRYGLSPSFWQTLREFPGILVAIDDLAEIDPAVDLVLNPNPGAETRCELAYQAASTRLLGETYALVRPEIVTRIPSGGGGILITLGGGSSAEQGRTIADALLERFPDEHIVLVGAEPDSRQHRHLHMIARCEIAPLLAAADLVICGGGVTALEAASLWRPMVVVVLAENQRPGAEYLGTCGAALVAHHMRDVPDHVGALLRSPDDALRIAHQAAAMIDGKGSARVMDRMRGIANSRCKTQARP